MTDAAWVKGMGQLVLALERRTLSPSEARARAGIYRRHLDDLSDEQWLQAVDRAVATMEWFPSIAALRRFAQPAALPEADAATLFDSILSDYEQGRHLDFRQVEEKYGRQAAMSFVSSGGRRRFEECGTEERAQWTRKAFIEAFKAQDESLSPVPALTDGEARGALEQAKKRLPSARGLGTLTRGMEE